MLVNGIKVGDKCVTDPSWHSSFDIESKIDLAPSIQCISPGRVVKEQAYRKPRLATYVLHNLHVHPIGSHVLILALNSVNVFEDFISSGTSAHVFGPLKDKVSVP